MNQQQATNTSPVLQVINQKELELRRAVEKARQQADALILAAREEAKQNRAQAEQAARAEAEALYQRGLEEARQEAKLLLETANQQAATLRRQTSVRLNSAARQIVALVLAQPAHKAEWNIEPAKVLMNRE